MVKLSLFRGVFLLKFNYLDKKQHGTSDFPVEYYYVDASHPRYHMAFHWHSEWELLRVIKGEFHLSLDDEQYVLKQGEVVLISGETLHGGEPFDCIYECLVFDLYSLFNKIEVLKSQIRPFYNGDIAPDRFYLFSDVQPNKILDIFSKGSSCIELEAFSAIASFFAWLIKEKRYKQGINKNPWSMQIKPVLEYIENHYNEELSLDMLASIAGMNARYFCKIFFSLTHYTPMNFVSFYRIEQAACLLDSTDLTITEISIECGFWESSYFTKVFKKFKGITPQKYRQSHKKI